MDEYDSSEWEESLTLTYNEYSNQFVDFAPKLAAAIGALIFGCSLAHALRVISRKLDRNLDSLFQDSAIADDTGQKKIRRSYAVIVSNLVLWMVIIFFISFTANLLGWHLVSTWIAGFGIYIPNLITGLLIILGGFLLGSVIIKAVMNTALSGGLDHAEGLGRIFQLVIMFTALIIGVEQIGINVSFLSNILTIIIGVQYLRKHCRIGEVMQIGNVEGNIVEATQTSIGLDTDYGRYVIPASQFQEQISSFRASNEPSKEVTDLIAEPAPKMSDHKIDLALAFLQSQPAAAAGILELQPIE
jgi:hypothetical protein